MSERMIWISSSLMAREDAPAAGAVCVVCPNITLPENSMAQTPRTANRRFSMLLPFVAGLKPLQERAELDRWICEVDDTIFGEISPMRISCTGLR
jgi:hypothetical protein